MFEGSMVISVVVVGGVPTVVHSRAAAVCLPLCAAPGAAGWCGLVPQQPDQGGWLIELQREVNTASLRHWPLPLLPLCLVPSRCNVESPDLDHLLYSYCRILSRREQSATGNRIELILIARPNRITYHCRRLWTVGKHPRCVFSLSLQNCCPSPR